MSLTANELLLIEISIGMLISESITGYMSPSLALDTLADEIGVGIVSRAHVTLSETEAERALGVVVLPPLG